MPGSIGKLKNMKHQLSASSLPHHNVDVNTSSSHGRVVDSSGELTAFSNHGQVVDSSGELTASPDHDRIVHTCGKPLSTPSHAQHDHSSNELIASTLEATVVTKETNLTVYIPSGTLTYDIGPKQLSRAVESGDFQLVKLLCTRGAGKRQHDPLCIAAKTGRQDLVELLLKYEADINNINGDFACSALDLALRHNHVECAKLLIQHGAKMDVVYALTYAVDHGAVDYMHFLSENYKPEIMDHFSQSAQFAKKLLHSAIRKGNCEIIGQILDAGVGINEVDSYLHTPLSASWSREVAQYLIKRGADVNLATDINCNETPLMHIIQNRICNNTSIVELCQVLIDNGASVNCRSGTGKTPLMMAASQGECVGMLQMLIKNGAEVNDKDNNGNTALKRVIRIDYFDKVSCSKDSFRDKKRVFSVHFIKGLTPLILSVVNGSIQNMTTLIEEGADVNMKDNQGNTALHHLLDVIPCHCEEMLACLLKAGSDVNCQNSDGLSPLMLAARKSLVQLVMSLLDAGADVNAVSKNNQSQTALSCLLDTGYINNDTLLCIDALLDRGAKSSYLSHECLHTLMLHGNIHIIPKLIEHGIGPADLDASQMFWNTATSNGPWTVSLLCMALLYGQISLARYFVDVLFLTSSDMSMFAGSKKMDRLLQRRFQVESLNLLQELSSQPMSLVQLSLVAVSSAVGPSPGRETRVDSLPLPQMMKDRLLFKSGDDKHLSLSRAPAASDISGIDINTLLGDHMDMFGFVHNYDDYHHDDFYPSNISDSDDDY